MAVSGQHAFFKIAVRSGISMKHEQCELLKCSLQDDVATALSTILQDYDMEVIDRVEALETFEKKPFLCRLDMPIQAVQELGFVIYFSILSKCENIIGFILPFRYCIYFAL